MSVCKERGIECDLATGLGFCSVTGCRKQNRVSNISIIPTVTVTDVPTVEYAPVVRCKDCKYRPHLRDAVDEDDAEELKHGHFNGFDLRFPTEGKCPCQVLDDEFYSWIPDDDWFCKGGERKSDE